MSEHDVDYGAIPTEKMNADSREIDGMNALQIAGLMNREDKTVAAAVQKVLPDIARAIDMVANSFSCGGRLIYAGAGTSGRLGVLDASECPPTFSVPHDMVNAIIAGGQGAVWRAREGAEDSPENGARAVSRLKVGPNDTVCGIAASGVTPFVIGACQKANELGASTIFLTCNPGADIRCARLVIAVDTGPEVIQGSTRLKAGTATKMVLNMLTTGAMVLNGKVYGNRMVDLTPSCHKLRQRAIRIICEESDVEADEAVKLLDAADGSVKTALLAALSRKMENFPVDNVRVEIKRARHRLKKSRGRIKDALPGRV